jgi:ABC-2 type transport system permease protein
LNKYFNIARLSLKERLTYRGDFLLSSFLRFLPMITSILLWKSVYGSSEQESLSGFTFKQVIAYLLLVNISRMFSSMPGLATNLARDVREGSIKKYLLQPIDLIGYLMSYRVAHKAAYISTSLVPYMILFGSCASFFDTFPTPVGCVYFFMSLILAFVIGFYFEVCLGMLSFWILEVTSLLYVVTTLSFFLSGHLIPLDLLDTTGWLDVLKNLPFAYLAYFPAAIFLQKVSDEELLLRFFIGALWAFFFFLLSRVILYFGLRKYSAYGA